FLPSGVLLTCLFDLHVISLPRCYTRQEWFPPAMSASVFSLFSLLTLSLLLLLCVIRKKRRMEGKYRPSAEEKKQSRATVPERPSLPLPLPKEERLI
uniref:Crumbs homolog 3b n=1 Tax=Cyprinodon variegatus TaxID=28743 RepID=A0A3Q2D7Y1_CYPVA